MTPEQRQNSNDPNQDCWAYGHNILALDIDLGIVHELGQLEPAL
jgi:hypothetical protein